MLRVAVCAAVNLLFFIYQFEDVDDALLNRSDAARICSGSRYQRFPAEPDAFPVQLAVLNDVYRDMLSHSLK